jgi:hypothetical protein
MRGRVRRILATVFTLFGVHALAPGLALAAEPTPATEEAPPVDATPDTATASDQKKPEPGTQKLRRVEEVPIPWKVWRIFDPKLSERTLGWSGGATFLRKLGENRQKWGVALYRTETIEERRSIWYLSIQRDFGIRVYSPWHIMPIPPMVTRYLFDGGLRLGPVEIGAGFTLLPFTIDFEHGRFGFVGPSPGATARVGLSVGKLKFSLRTEHEYLWRWGGQRRQVFPPTGSSLWEALKFWQWTAQPDAMTTGVVLEISGEQPKQLRSGGHPLVFIK